MNEDQVMQVADQVCKCVEGMTLSELTVCLWDVVGKNPDVLAAFTGVVAHQGDILGAAKAEIKFTKKGVELQFVAPRGGSLRVPGKTDEKDV